MFVILLPLLFLGYLYLKLHYYKYSKFYPKNYSNKKFIKESEKIKHTTEINRDRFLNKKIPTDLSEGSLQKP